MADEKKIKLTIDDQDIEVSAGTTVLEAAKTLGIKIPTLCYHEALSPYGACRLCMVEVTQGNRTTVKASCQLISDEGMTVKTDSDRLAKGRKIMAELLLARCPDSERIQDIARQFGVTEPRLEKKNEKCILCGLCVRMCSERMGVSAIGFANRGSRREVVPPFDEFSDVCQTCGACTFICPTNAINFEELSENKPVTIHSEFNLELIDRPVISIPFPQAVPNCPTIDKEHCIHFLRGTCGICEKVCKADAINYEDKDEELDINVGSVILTSGFDLFEPSLKSEYGYNEYKNVVSALQYERLMAPTGPSGGHIYRPSDYEKPKRVAWLQCVGSRDIQAGNEYCSAVCCTYATKEAIITREDLPGSECTIFFMDMRTFGKGFEEFYNRAKEEYGVKYVRARAAHVEEVENNNLKIVYRDEDGTSRQDEFDLVVLSSGLRPRGDFNKLVEILGVEQNDYGFVKTGHFTPSVTNKPGIFVAGAISEPKDIPDTVAQSLGVVSKASELIHENRGTELTKIEYPPETTETDEPRVGVFVCHCGVNIASVVDVPHVAEFASTLPNVVFSDNNLFSCSGDTQTRIKEMIKEHNLNRVIVASCTPRTHEPLFQETVREAGLNPFLFDLVSIREHCSWVHRDQPEVATEKAKLVISMAVNKVSRNMPVQKEPVEIAKSVLIIGGGISGMNAALDVAAQGFEASIIEMEPELGGNMRNIPHLFTDDDPQAYLKDLIAKVEENPGISIYKNSRLTGLDGYVGNFEASVSGSEDKIKAGAIIVAVGAKELKPKGLFHYGDHPRIMTQLEFDKALAEGTLDEMDVKNIVMIQCVGSREGSDGERPYCSRVCCSTAVKNALRFTDERKDRRVLVLYRDIRTYGFKEKYYRSARERGIIFTRYLQEAPPEVSIEDDKLKIDFKDLIVNREFTTRPDLIVLSAATVPFTEENIELAQMLKVPLTLNNFFLEAHTKIAPLDFATSGIFLCGTCHSPKFSDESIFQASGAAARAMSVISQEGISTEGIPAMIDEARCVGCGLCEANCAYNAVVVNPDRGVAEVNEVLCKGCGACQAVCPSSVPHLRQFGINQIMRMIETATEEL